MRIGMIVQNKFSGNIGRVTGNGYSPAGNPNVTVDCSGVETHWLVSCLVQDR